MLESRKRAIEGTNCTDDSEDVDINEQKIEAMTQLYLDTLQNASVLASQLESMKQHNASITSATRRKISALKRITSSQLHDALSGLDSITAAYNDLQHKNAILCAQLSDQKKDNLIYKQKVETSTNELQKKNKIIASLQSELHETVTANSKIKASASNLGVTNDELQSELRMCKKQLGSFQNAYASMYAAALGVDLGPLSIKASTSVDELQELIAGATIVVQELVVPSNAGVGLPLSAVVAIQGLGIGNEAIAQLGAQGVVGGAFQIGADSAAVLVNAGTMGKAVVQCCEGAALYDAVLLGQGCADVKAAAVAGPVGVRSAIVGR